MLVSFWRPEGDEHDCALASEDIAATFNGHPMSPIEGVQVPFWEWDRFGMPENPNCFEPTFRMTLSRESGTSRYSFHYCGRAVDINQALGGGKGQRYYIIQETVGQHTYWRIYCKTTLQDGTQGMVSGVDGSARAVPARSRMQVAVQKRMVGGL